MNDDFVGVVTDPLALWKCGASYFPEIATQYASAGSAFGAAAQTGESSYTRMVPGVRGSEGSLGPGPVPYFVESLRNRLHTAIGTSVDNLFATGDALEKVAWAYATTDGDSAKMIQDVTELLDENRNGEDTDQPIWTDDERDKIRDGVGEPTKEY